MVMRVRKIIHHEKVLFGAWGWYFLGGYICTPKKEPSSIATIPPESVDKIFT